MESTLDLPAVHRAIQGLDEDGIVRLASEASSAERGSWFAQARAIGELQRRARYRGGVVAKHAAALRISQATAFELGTIDRRILLPRLKAEGDAARFPIREKRFYVTAYKVAAALDQDALGILAFGEQQREKNKRFSARALREHFGVAGSGAHPMQRHLVALAGLRAAERERFVRAVEDPAEIIRLAERAAESARALVADLRGQAGE